MIDQTSQRPDRDAPAAPLQPGSSNPKRRHDIDWLRTIALGLLIIYHGSLWFLSPEALPPAVVPGLLRNDEPLDWLVPMLSLLSVWRIPILFLISGMGVRFAQEKRAWRELVADRALRIGLPLVFGVLVITPITALFISLALPLPTGYYPNLGHLWFVANIAAYVIILLPALSWLKRHPRNPLAHLLSGMLAHPLLLLLLPLPLVLETLLLHPQMFVLYVQTAHGFWLGLLCFFIGYLLASAGEIFWAAAGRMRWVTLSLAVVLFGVRLWTSPTFVEAPLGWLAAAESMHWMLAALGFGGLMLDRPSRALGYFSRAVFPVYIIHFPIQTGICVFVLPLALPAIFKWILVIAGTFALCLLLYEFVIRRVKWLRPLFGMRLSDTARS